MIDNDELMNIYGGAVSEGLIIGIVSAVLTFIAGVIDGYINPGKCNNG